MAATSNPPLLDPPPADFETVFEEAPDAILLVDDARAFLAGNRCARELLQVSADQLRAMHVEDVIAGDDSATRLAEGWTILREEGRLSGSFTLRASDGSEREVEYSSRANYEPGRHLSILRPVAGSARSAATGRLSSREREVLRLLAGGATGAQIADELYLSRATVATHVRNAMVKLEAHTRIEAVVIALREGEIEL